MNTAGEQAARRILVIDDEPEIRACVIDVLCDEGYTAAGAVNGRDALEQLARADVLPDLILLDLLMPVMDGARFRELQLADPKLATIPTMIVSANAQVRETATRLGVTAWLKKPVDLFLLLDAVRAQLRR